ncbi:hypothetical protein ACFVHS_14880 [Streptomyces sp. NPDC057746]|uniref:hypothetical protein n=1 Tax=Streptomyces sp. NPDC057746 TaxID=3346237 RepID=UPI0011038667|nr:hypothetical protein E4K10_30685 [Streptomyces sp. T1317-0309]
MSGTSGSYNPASHDHDSIVLADDFDLMPTAINVWTGVGINVTLPRAGKYRVEAEVRAAVVGGGFVTARFFNATASQAVPQALRLVNQLNGAQPNQGVNNTAPITAFVTVSGPTVIRVEAMRGDATGAQTAASITSGAAGQTWMGWEQIG